MDDKEPLKFDITAAATESQMPVTKGETIKAKDTSERLLDLIEQVVTTIEPTSWSTNVGVVGISATGSQRRINITGQGEGCIIARRGTTG